MKPQSFQVVDSQGNIVAHFNNHIGDRSLYSIQHLVGKQDMHGTDIYEDATLYGASGRTYTAKMDGIYLNSRLSKLHCGWESVLLTGISLQKPVPLTFEDLVEDETFRYRSQKYSPTEYSLKLGANNTYKKNQLSREVVRVEVTVKEISQ